MSLAATKKPRRVNIAALVNILVGIVSFCSIILLVKNPDIDSQIQIDSSRVWIGSVFPGALILSSAWAFFSRRKGHFIMLAVAVIYYGAHIYQSVWVLTYANALFDSRGESMLWAGTIRTSLELSLTAWAVLSSKTRSYFAVRHNAL